MWLLIDLGNSRSKWAQWNGHGYTGRGALVQGEPGFGAALQAAFAPMPVPERVIVASVAGPDVQSVVADAVRAAWRIEPGILETQARQCGVQNGYVEPAQMGVDRWLTLLAARQRWHAPVCVVDAGTAVTVDVVGADGRHLGGLIAPGIECSRRVLETGTAGIRADARTPGAGLGLSTAECVANGALLGNIGMVRLALDVMEQSCGPGGVLVLTGGGAALLAPHLPAGTRVEPDLLFDGMRLAAAGGDP